ITSEQIRAAVVDRTAVARIAYLRSRAPGLRPPGLTGVPRRSTRAGSQSRSSPVATRTAPISRPRALKALQLARQAFALIVPFCQKALALRRRTVFGEIVVDEFDLGKVGRLWRRLCILVGRHLVGF